MYSDESRRGKDAWEGKTDGASRGREDGRGGREGKEGGRGGKEGGRESE